MSARTTRAAARQRIMAAMTAALERMIPADEAQPLRGGTFGEWEDQAEEVARAVLPTVLEERAGLEETATVEQAGRCPMCGSDRVHLEQRQVKQEVRTRHGVVVLDEQRCRCRACGRTFSPSGS